MLAALDATSWWPVLIGAAALFAIMCRAWNMRHRLGPAPDMPYRHLLVQGTGGDVAPDDRGHARFHSVSIMNREIRALARARIITLWGKRCGRGALMRIDDRYWNEGGAIDDLAAAREGRGRTYRSPVDQDATWYDDLHFSTSEARRLLQDWMAVTAREVLRNVPERIDP
jgi:hypothetical protein